jgi:hypothetical protein
MAGWFLGRKAKPEGRGYFNLAFSPLERGVEKYGQK